MVPSFHTPCRAEREPGARRLRALIVTDCLVPGLRLRHFTIERDGKIGAV